RPVAARELDGRHDMEHHGHEQYDAQQPEQLVDRVMQEVRVGVEPYRALEDLQIADHVHDDEGDHDEPGHRHDHLLANRGAPEPHGPPGCVPRVHNCTSFMGSRTASALRPSSTRSLLVSSTSRMRSMPARPSLQGTPRKRPENPYSPSSQAAQGNTRFRSCTMASHICTAAADGA